jgi:UDP-sugar transporter A1/2/3
VVGCIISGFAGVYFEGILKGSAPVSLWMRNIQRGIFTIPFSFVGIFVQNLSDIRENGFLYGFDALVWSVVLMYGSLGISVVVCIKYADNILLARLRSFLRC